MLDVSDGFCISEAFDVGVGDDMDFARIAVMVCVLVGDRVGASHESQAEDPHTDWAIERSWLSHMSTRALRQLCTLG